MVENMHQSNRQRLYELEKEVDRLRRAAEEAVRTAGSQCSMQEALQKIRQAEQEMVIAEGTPHAFFAPGQLAVLRDSLARCRGWLNAGATDAAAATAEVISAQVRLLTARVLGGQREWIMMFNAYAPQLDQLTQEMGRCSLPFTTPAGEFIRDDQCLDYFSTGMFTRARGWLEEECRCLLEPVRTDATAAFMRGALPSIHMLSARLRGLDAQKARCMAAVRAADKEMYYSDERLEAGLKLAKALALEGYTLLECCFEEENALKAYRLQADLGGIRVTLRIVPVRFRGIAEANRITISCEGVETGQAERIAEAWRQRSAEVCSGLQTESIIDKGGRKRKRAISDNEPSPMLYAESLLPASRET